MAIDKLSKVTALGSSDLLALFSGALGADAAVTLSTLVAWLQSQLTNGSGGLVSQYASPNASGATITVNPPTTGASVFLLLTPLAAYAATTITLPAQALCVHGQEVLITCTQAVTTLTTSGNGASVNGAPSALSANSFFSLRYDGVNASWYRVG
jgi:hypothetical protein